MFLYKVKREEVAYWRKANAIHGWFERKIEEYGESLENCRDYPVTKEDLIELRDTCQKIIDKSKIVKGVIKNGERYNHSRNEWEPIMSQGRVITNPELAQELLPTKSGFFYGSTEYDEHYIEDLKETIDQIDRVLETTNFDEEEICYSAWW